MKIRKKNGKNTKIIFFISFDGVLNISINGHFIGFGSFLNRFFGWSF